jgi:hypothetical protein
VKKDKADKRKSKEDRATGATSTNAASMQTKDDAASQKKQAAIELRAQKKAGREAIAVAATAKRKEAQCQIEWDAALLVEERLLKQSHSPSNKNKDTVLRRSP